MSTFLKNLLKVIHFEINIKISTQLSAKSVRFSNLKNTLVIYTKKIFYYQNNYFESFCYARSFVFF